MSSEIKKQKNVNVPEESLKELLEELESLSEEEQNSIISGIKDKKKASLVRAYLAL